MKKKKYTQTQQVIDTLRRNGGYATLGNLYHLVDTSAWATNTPHESIRRIVQNSPDIFKIRPGLWALEECRDEVIQKIALKPGNKRSEETFTHGYYQGLLVEIGKFKRLTTYVPAQDQNRLFIDRRLGEIADTTDLPDFTYDNLKRRARTIDVIWFNERKMPSCFYEVEHSTDIKNSLSKFYELQDFHSDFFIVADAVREKEFEDKLHVSMFSPIEKRVRFLKYSQVAKLYEGMKKIQCNLW
ncbi:MAG: hypothetical protein IJ557_11065 [Bacteroidaceae bacterium]|nr:hypothetical protein [Bacteroidaceae bacterium]